MVRLIHFSGTIQEYFELRELIKILLPTDLVSNNNTITFAGKKFNRMSRQSGNNK